MAIFGRRQSEPDEKPEIKALAPQQPIGFETVLGASTVLNGKFSSKGNVRLDGEFTGTLDITGNILVGETAKINADIDARNISIAGAVRGNVIGNKVQLLRTGRIWGDIKANALTIEEGAFIDGKITMQGKDAPKALETVAASPEALPVSEIEAESTSETVAAKPEESAAAEVVDETHD